MTMTQREIIHIGDSRWSPAQMNWRIVVRYLGSSLSRNWIAYLALIPVLGLTSFTWAQQAGGGSGVQSPAAGSSGLENTPIVSDWSEHYLVFPNLGTAQAALQNGTYDRWLRITEDPRYVMEQRMRTGSGASHAVAAANAALSANPVATPQSQQTAVPTAVPDYPAGHLPRGLMKALVAPPSAASSTGNATASSEIATASNSPRDWSEMLGANATVGLGNFPATSVFTDGSLSCSDDYAVYATSLPGSSSQADIAAFNELYSVCSPRPSPYWAYNTGGTVITSESISLDSTQIVFVQTDNTTGDADLVVLKWAPSSGSVASPVTLTSNSSYPSCTAPCMISIPFSGSVTDSMSSPYVDYSTGNVYVGDDDGNLHQFINVFTSTTPSEATSPWPVTVNPSTQAAISETVYDDGYVLVSDYQIDPDLDCESGACGYMYAVNASTGAVTQSAQLDYEFGIYGFTLDGGNGLLYVSVGADNSTSCSAGPCAAVYQLAENFGAGSTGPEATVGAGTEPLFSGDFDNQYWLSGAPATGHLYIVGGTGPENNTLYAITIDNNVMTSGAATAGPELATNYTNGYYAAGLPITEYCNAGDGSSCTSSEGTDYLFIGVLSFGEQFSSNPCSNQSLSNGCIMSFTAPASGVISSSATPNATLPVAGGPSGVVIDYSSNIYFSTLYNQTCATSGGTGGCAVSATQSGLQ